MKLIHAIVHQDDAKSVVDALIKNRFSATSSFSTGGFSGLTSVTLVSCVDEDRLETALEIIKENVKSRKGLPRQGSTGQPIDVCGAVFVLDVARFERL
jgi:uncharacterized protein YaaQ